MIKRIIRTILQPLEITDEKIMLEEMISNDEEKIDKILATIEKGTSKLSYVDQNQLTFDFMNQNMALSS